MPELASQKALLCPLCRASHSDDFHQDKTRNYLRCPACHLVFVPAQHYISREDEKVQYDSHQNSPDDPDYRAFLSRLFIPVNERLSPGSAGLDFGCGPGPTLSVMFQEAGHSVALYDPHYAPDTSLLDQQYDFVTASEVVEHLSDPGNELNRIWQCLKPGGHFGIMTKLVIDQDAFSRWHYKNEPTHICFYSTQTFQWLAESWKAEIQFYGKDVVIFSKG